MFNDVCNCLIDGQNDSLVALGQQVGVLQDLAHEVANQNETVGPGWKADFWSDGSGGSHEGFPW